MGCGIGAGLAGLFGLFALGYALIGIPAKARFARRAHDVMGVVVAAKRGRAREQAGFFYDLRVRFTTADGRTIETECETADEREAVAGTQLPMQYDPAAPERARRRHSSATLVGGFVTALLVALFLGGFAVFLLGRMAAGDC